MVAASFIDFFWSILIVFFMIIYFMMLFQVVIDVSFGATTPPGSRRRSG